MAVVRWSIRRATRRLTTTGGSSSSSSLIRYSSSDPQSTCRPPLPVQYLLAYDDNNFDPATHQRTDVSFDPIDGTPPLSKPRSSCESPQFISWQQCNYNDDATEEDSRWCLTTKQYNNNDNDGATATHRKSYFTTEWITTHTERWRANVNDYDSSIDDTNNNYNNQTTMTDDTDTNNHNVKRILWSHWTENIVRDTKTSPILFQYDNLGLYNKNNQQYQPKQSSEQQKAKKEDEQRRLLQVLYQYGIVLITGTPSYTTTLPIVDDDDDDDVSGSRNNLDKRRSMNNDKTTTTAESAILHLARIIGYYPQQTLYGAGVWSTSSLSSFHDDDNSISLSSSCSSTADSAYGNTSLPLHTDMTYMATPPGVQIFLMVQPATAATTATTAANGSTTTINNNPPPTGQSIYIDGFAAARQLLLEHPHYFQLLATTPRQYRCIDDSNIEKGWHLAFTGPIIETIPSSSGGDALVKSIRHNDLDRLPDLPPYPSTTEATTTTTNDEFYNQLKVAHEAWDDILRRDSMRLVLNLQPGDCILVSNHRCLHGRYAFETSASHPRVVMGCYVGMDELNSKWRQAGFRVL